MIWERESGAWSVGTIESNRNGSIARSAGMRFGVTLQSKIRTRSTQDKDFLGKNSWELK